MEQMCKRPQIPTAISSMDGILTVALKQYLSDDEVNDNLL